MVKEFYLQHSLNSKTYYYWKKKYEGRGSNGFLPVVIDETPNKSKHCHHSISRWHPCGI
jgi:hypothetical protein